MRGELFFTQVYEKAFDGVVQKEQFPFIKFFRNDELALFHSKPDELKILTPMAMFKCNQTVKIEPCDYIQLSTNTLKTQLAFVTKHNDSNEQRRQGRLVLVNFPYFSEPVLDQTFQRAHELKLVWSPSSRDILTQARTCSSRQVISSTRQAGHTMERTPYTFSEV